MNTPTPAASSSVTGGETITRPKPVTNTPTPTQSQHHPKVDSSIMACCANSTLVSVRSNNPVLLLQVPTTVTVTRPVPVMTTSSSIPAHKNFKKRSRPTEEDIPRKHHQRVSVVAQSVPVPVPMTHGFARPAPVGPPATSGTTMIAIMSSLKTSSGSSSSASAVPSSVAADAHAQEISHTEHSHSDMELTREQIDDVIDKVDLPSHFSFSLTALQLPQQQQTLKKKKARQAPPLPLSANMALVCKPEPETMFSSSNSVGSVRSNVSDSASLDDSTNKKTATAGRWTREEHEAFLEGLKIHGREWKKVAQEIPTRTSAQIRSHAQKYFAKLARDEQQQLSSQAVSMGMGMGMNAAVGVGGISADMDEVESEYPPSVLQRVEQILLDPMGAEAEVAETLKRLRSRYNELHKKLQMQEQQKHQTQPTNDYDGSDYGRGDKFSTSGQYGSTPTNFTFLSTQPQNVVEGPEHAMSPPRPRATSSSNAASSPSRLRSPITFSSESLALHSNELIALTVLGGELYRSASRDDLNTLSKPNLKIQPMATGVPATATTHASQANQSDSDTSKEDKSMHNN